MEPLLIILVPGIVGGLGLALFHARFPGVPEGIPESSPLEQPSTNVINMARIRVKGVGGFGMVAMAATVAIFVPRIRLTMAIALVLGAALAAGLIALRRRQGPLPSGNDPGAHAMFPFEAPAAPRSGERPGGAWPRRCTSAAIR